MKKETEILIIGAGPKAASIVAKAHVLNTLKIDKIHISVIEKNIYASNWMGLNGYTTGNEELGTRPEKDVGFPYLSQEYGSENSKVNNMMMKFSWHSYLIHKQQYRHWVDEGLNHPAHNEFGDYLRWVFENANEGIDYIKGEVTNVRHDESKWNVEYINNENETVEIAAKKGLVFTGVGIPKKLPCSEEAEKNVYTANVLRDKAKVLNINNNTKMCIVGVGESSSTLALHMIDTYGNDIDITFVSPNLAFSRAESYLENTIYSTPESVRWDNLPLKIRRDFISRTDRGVMSPVSLEKIIKHKKTRFLVGMVKYIQRSKSGKVEMIVDQGDELVRKEFDLIANCIGYDPLNFANELLFKSLNTIEELSGIDIKNYEDVSLNLDSSFALNNLNPKLHLPALAGLMHGPGFANLSCLGLLSDRILSAYSNKNNMYNFNINLSSKLPA